MDRWALVTAILVGLGVALALLARVPWRLRLTFQARGEPDGAWAVAGGGSCGPLAVTGVAARGVPLRIQLHLFGRTVLTRSIRRRPRSPTEPEPSLPWKVRLDRLRRARSRFTRWFDPWELSLFLVRERRRIRVDRLDVDVDLSLRDVALTGRVLGALIVLDALLPPPLALRARSDWASTDRARANVTGTLRFWPVLLLIDTLWWTVRNVRLRAPAPGPEAKAAA